MHSPIHFAETVRGVDRVVHVAWALIGIKTIVVWWAIIHWNVPFSPMWIVGPTIAFALLATTAWVLAPKSEMDR